ncbi:MAG TPA: isoprenylcysteine carboxylmethyltransferase family protein [Candidatus Acidoferrales bacterium]|jgi:protein-S-isoprenylcysteine O-methyltransferase Ste14|nr:isoprenylcysteine carboxylmethyltransferase family protein [Candidatus Acidoferrales bacterium]
MTPIEARYIVNGLWVAWLAYWMIAARGMKRTSYRDSPAFQIPQILLMLVGFYLLSTNSVRSGHLSESFVPMEPALLAAGTALTFAGLAFAVWARVHLGRNWSGGVRIALDQELIRSGPYARIRHPIYSGMLAAAFGTAIVVGRWYALLGAGLATLGFWLKARREEALLAREFGEKFEERRRHTGFFFPRFF